MIQDFELNELLISGEYAFLRGLEINRLTSKEDQKETIVHQAGFLCFTKRIRWYLEIPQSYDESASE